MNFAWVGLPGLHGDSLPSRFEITRGHTWHTRVTQSHPERVRLSDTTASPLMCCQNKHHHLFLSVFIPWHFIWGFVYVDSVWSAAHSQPSALQYPILVQPQSSGTPEPCPTAEPRAPLPGNSHLFLFPCMCTGCLQQLQIFAKPLLNLKIS